MVEFLESFIDHHISRAVRGEIKNCVRNCHAKGLHSIVLHDEPGNRIRIFFADFDHELWHNDLTLNMPMSVAIHSHHCDITLLGLPGGTSSVVNKIYNKPFPNISGRFYKCSYTSAIKTGKGSLKKISDEKLSVYMNEDKILKPGVSRTMGAKELHTVWVEQGCSATWMVIEGKEDESYDSNCYTNSHVFDTRKLYIKDPTLAISVLKAIKNGLEQNGLR